MSVPVPLVASARSSSRVAIFDGLRGVAIILVVLSHGWTLWPTDGLQSNRFTNALFTCGDYAVSIFFVIGFFLATRQLLGRAASAPGLRPDVAFVRRFLRLSGQVYSLLLVLVIVSVLDTSNPYPDTATRTSVLRALSYTWNWYVENAALSARPDLGHLWYVSVDLQVFAIVLLIVWLLRRRPAWLLVALTGVMVSMWLWRWHVYQTEGDFSALLRTWARGDAPVAGAVAAAALPYLQRLPVVIRRAPALAWLGVVSLIPLAYVNGPTRAYFGWQGVLLDVALMVVVLACTLAPPPRVLAAVLSVRPLVVLGRSSLSVYLWHYPIFWYVSRHSYGWSWERRTVVGLLLTAVFALLSNLLVERRVQRLLSSPTWRQTDEGLPAFAVARLRAWFAERRHRVDETASGVAVADEPAPPSRR